MNDLVLTLVCTNFGIVAGIGDVIEGENFIEIRESELFDGLTKWTDTQEETNGYAFYLLNNATETIAVPISSVKYIQYIPIIPVIE